MPKVVGRLHGRHRRRPAGRGCPAGGARGSSYDCCGCVAGSMEQLTLPAACWPAVLQHPRAVVGMSSGVGAPAWQVAPEVAPAGPPSHVFERRNLPL